MTETAVLDIGVVETHPDAVVGNLIGTYQRRVQPSLESGKISYGPLHSFRVLLIESRHSIMAAGSEAYSAYLTALRQIEIGLNGSERTSGVSEDKRAKFLKTSLDSQLSTIHARFHRSQTYEVNRRRLLN